MTDQTDTDTIVVEGENIPLDLLLWRRFRTRTPGLVEQSLDLNPGLSGFGPILPVGTKVSIPVGLPEPSAERRPVVRLWD